MKKTMVMVLLIASIFLCSCANKQLPANSSPESNEAKAQLEENTNSMATEPTPDVSLDAESAFDTQDSVDFETEDILSQIKTSVGIPFRLWNNQSQVLHCISVFESYAKREVERKQIPLTKNKVSWSGISLRTYSPLQEHGTKIFYLICPGKRQRLSQTEWYMILCQAIS